MAADGAPATGAKRFDPSDLLPAARFHALYEQEFTEEVLVHLQHPDGRPAPSTLPWGPASFPLEETLPVIRATLRSGVGQLIVVPATPPPVQQKEWPKVALFIAPLLHRSPRTDWLGNPLPTRHPYPAELRVGAAGSEDNPFDLRAPGNRAWFLDRCKALVAATAPAFAFATEDPRALSTIESGDPRQIAWPTTYYGPALANRLGRTRLRTAPAWKVEETTDDGTWVYLSETPFAWEGAASERARHVARHLGLADAFGPGGLAA